MIEIKGKYDFSSMSGGEFIKNKIIGLLFKIKH
ncbi:MAG: hypothetical protein AWU54_2373, partial [Candidatus Frackibacter sp. T328-2]